MAADAGLVDAAVIERLASDAVLSALCPDGVYWDLRPGGSPSPGRFVIVSLFDFRAVPGLSNRVLYERAVYWVVARMADTSRAPARQAAARINELLDRYLLDLTPAGYTAMHTERIDRRADTEADPLNKTLWHHHGGQYELTSYPT